MNQSQIEQMLEKASNEHPVLLQVVSVKDLARDRYTGPRVVGTVREAQRDFKYLVENDPLVKKDPQDFELFQIGIFNPVNAEMQSISPVRISRGLDFKQA